MNPLRIKILETLAKHKNRWLKTKTIAKELNLGTVDGINRISVLLYRLRNFPNIERRSNSHAYQYRYFEEIKRHPTNILPSAVSKAKSGGNAKRDNANFEFVERIEPEERYCEICESYKQISFRAQREESVVFLCEKHGEAVDKHLFGYGGAFQ